MPDWDNTESRESGEDAAWRELVARFDEPVLATEPAPWPERENVSGASDPRGGGPSPSAGGAPEAERLPRTADSPGTDALLRPGGGPETGGRPGPDSPGPAGRRDGGDAPVAGTSSRKAPGQTGTDRPDDSRPGGLEAGEPGRGAEEMRSANGVRGFDDEEVRGAFGADGLLRASEPDVIQAARRDRTTSAHGNRSRKIRSAPARADRRRGPLRSARPSPAAQA